MFQLYEFLREYKEKTGMNNRDLASLVGVHVNTVQSWVSATRYPTFDVAQDALGKLGYEIKVARKSKPKEAKDPTSPDYEKAIYERGRMSMLQDIKKDTKQIFDKYI